MTACSSSCCEQLKSSPNATQKQSKSSLSLDRDGRDSCCDVKDPLSDKASNGVPGNARDFSQPEAIEPSCNDGNPCDSTDLAKDHGYNRAEASLATSFQDTCCPGSSEQTEGDCNKMNVGDDSCEVDCCAATTQEAQNNFGYRTKGIKDSDGCCAPKSLDHDYKKSRRSPPSPCHANDYSDPNCCKDNAIPCCDTSCLDRIALRQCRNEYLATYLEEASENSRSTSTCHGSKDGKPCSHHTRTTRDKYTATLEALGCICRALLALGQESCCETQKRSPIERKRCSKKSSQSVKCASVESCCDMGTSTGSFSAEARPRSRKDCRDSISKAEGDTALKGCHGKFKALCVGNPGANAHCIEEKFSGPIERLRNGFSDGAHASDLEKGLSGNEHIVLSISGMTCTGCETKLKRALDTVQSVNNLKTSLVLARAEFDLDLAAGSLVDVMKHLEKTTEFKCERVINQGSSVDLLAPGDSSEFVQLNWPHGVTDMRVIDKKTVQVAYDAKIIGARDLVEKGWGIPINLAAPRLDPSLEAGNKHVRHIGYMTLLSIILTIPVLVLAWAPLSPKEITYGSASLALATIVQLAIAGPFYPKALKSLVFSRVIEMDLLIVLSTSAAFIFSVISFGYLVAGQPLSTGEFFETSTLLVTLIMVGRFVAALARQKAVESFSIRSLQESTAILVDEIGGQEKEIDTRLLQYGDTFKVLPDSRFPTDGTVIAGSSDVNESMVTGELRPVEKHVKSTVIAGSINGSGTLIVRLIRLPGDDTISTIARMVDEAKISKPKIQDIADRIASYFVPAVIGLTIITLVVWIVIGVAVRKQSGPEATIQAITYAMTVLIVSCPCGIGLAVPMVIVIASGVAADRGVIFKSADSIGVAYRTSHVVFDKTGTLTQGKLTVVVEEYIGSHSSSYTPLLLGLLSNSKHPVSAALMTHLKAKGVLESVVSDSKTYVGKGIEGTALGLVLRAGNSRWLNVSSDPRVQSILSQGHTTFCFTVNNSLAAVFGLEDSLRPDALSTITHLQKRGISVHVISGDDDGAVCSVATRLSIPSTNIRSRCTPADKQAYIQDLISIRTHQSSANKNQHPVVIFCGDGTNDAVALAQATIGVHMNEGTDVAKSAADVILMRPSLAGIITTLTVSEKSVNRIKFNFGWSFIYNLFAILLGAGAFVDARIPPKFAGLGELVSVLPVIVAAVLLRWSKI